MHYNATMHCSTDGTVQLPHGEEGTDAGGSGRGKADLPDDAPANL